MSSLDQDPGAFGFIITCFSNGETMPAWTDGRRAVMLLGTKSSQGDLVLSR